MEKQFDVFLAHSSKDKPLIRHIYRELKQRGVRPWLDEEEIKPGKQFQKEIQQAIVEQVKAAAICLGQDGLSSWQALELQSFISQCVEQNVDVIPVLLPGVQEIPNELPFLELFQAVSFEGEINDKKAFDKLEWGIKGQSFKEKRGHSEDERNKIPVGPILFIVGLVLIASQDIWMPSIHRAICSLLPNKVWISDNPDRLERYFDNESLNRSQNFRVGSGRCVDTSDSHDELLRLRQLN